MNLNHAIFRSEPTMTLNDLQQIGSHNKREKLFFKSNPDIKLEMSKYNVELVPLVEKYVKGFYNITKDYKKDTFDSMNKVIDDATNIMSLQLGSEIVKEATMGEIKHYFDEKYIKRDVVNISIVATKEDELFDYIGYERYYCVPKYNELDDDYEKDKDDDFDLNL